MLVALEALPLRRLADRADQIIAVALYAWLCARLVPHTFPPEHLHPLMLLLSEGVVVLFLLVRRGTDKISLHPRDWIVALGGTFAPLLVVKVETVFLPQVGLVLILIGFVIHFGAKLALRRSIGMVPADRGVKTLDLYCLHPAPDVSRIHHFACWGAVGLERNCLFTRGAPCQPNFPGKTLSVAESRLTRLLLESAVPTDSRRDLNVS